QRREVHRHRAILVLVAERALFALFVFQLCPGGLGQVFLGGQLQCLGVQLDFKFLLRAVREFEGVEKADGLVITAVGHAFPGVRQGRRQENRGGDNDTIIVDVTKDKRTLRTTFSLRRSDPFTSSGLLLLTTCSHKASTPIFRALRPCRLSPPGTSRPAWPGS